MPYDLTDLYDAILFSVQGLREHATDDINVPTWFSVRYDANTGTKFKDELWHDGELFDPFLYITAYRLTGNST
ncbi:MAG: hypothetical protein ACE5OY_03960, partial [Candidatus Bathyarchaeia archaeon]